MERDEDWRFTIGQGMGVLVVAYRRAGEKGRVVVGLLGNWGKEKESLWDFMAGAKRINLPRPLPLLA